MPNFIQKLKGIEKTPKRLPPKNETKGKLYLYLLLVMGKIYLDIQQRYI